MNKSAGILVSTGLLSILFWALTYRWVFSSVKFQDFGFLIGLIVVFSFLVAFVGLGLLFLKTYLFKVILIFLSGIPLFFFFDFNPLYILAITALFWIQIYAAGVISDEARERNKINVKVILRRGAPAIITSLFIMISFAYYLTPQVQAIAKNKSLPVTFQPLIKQIMINVFRGELENLSSSQKESVSNQASSEVFRQLNDLVRPAIQFVPPLLAFALFLLLQSLAVLFVWLAVLFGVIIFKILKSVEFFTISEKAVKMEVIEV